jgi:serine/threonine-protein kinase 24/25/MST4
MTSRGLVITEEQEEISGLPTPSSPNGSVLSSATAATAPPESPTRKSPIAELLYMRWLEGLKLKWPSMLSS